jgi:dephospho-CoA kinase
MLIIGLTGLIASGKSAVAALLVPRGVLHIDCDQLAKEATAAGTPGFEQVVGRFGPEVVASNGQLDRPRLARIVFNDPAALADLEAIVHPRVRVLRDERLAAARDEVVVVEAIKLVEAGFHRRCHSLWVVTAPHALRIQRLIHLRGMEEPAARERVMAQGDDAEKLRLANEVILNDGNRLRLEAQVEAAWERTVAWLPPEGSTK